MTAADELLGAIDDATVSAIVAHANGTCHLSEWSCSYCESAGVEWVEIDEQWAHVIRDVEQLRTLETWRLKWNEDLAAWLYFPPAADRVSV